MTIEERKIQVKPQEQKLTLENRENLHVSGVRDVESFSETAVRLDTVQGRLSVLGEGLHIQKLSVETGELSLQGKINALEYAKNNRRREKGSFLESLFR